MRRVGLDRVENLAGLSRASLTRRYGPTLVRRLDQALGAVEETIDFLRPEISWFERLAFAEPIATPEDLARTLALLAERLCRRLAGAAKGGARFEAAFHRVDGRVERIAIATALAARDAQRLARLLGEKLERVDPGFGIEVATLAAGRVAALPPTQPSLATGAESRQGDLALLVDTLGNRIGFERVWRAAPRESHLPERAVARVPPLAARRGITWPADRPRPVRLLGRPEPIEAVAPVPDDPPVMFRWRGVLRRVRRAEGPERIAFEWWRQPAPAGRAEPDLVRDYYRVEDEEGGRFWIYRAGLYAPDRRARWFLHGLFG